MTVPWFECDPALFVRLEGLLRAKYPTMHALIENGACRLRGTYAPVEDDRYSLEIALPHDYPASMPAVWETGGRIPRVMDRHVSPADGSLCLGVPLALWLELRDIYTIERVIEGPIRSFLLGNSLVEQGEPWPHGERPHGSAGILEHFGEMIGTADPMRVGSLVVRLLDGKLKGHWECPCGSGKIIRKCHRREIEALRQVPRRLLKDTVHVIASEMKKTPDG